MALVTFRELREFVERNRAVRRRMRERPSDRVLEDVAMLLRIFDDEILRRRARSTQERSGTSEE